MSLKQKTGTEIMDATVPETNHWSVDKRIPLALIITILLQTAGFAFYMGQLSSRVTELERELTAQQGNRERLTRVEVQLENILRSVGNIERKIDRTPL